MYTNRMRENKLGCIKLPIWNVSPTTQLIDGRPNILDHKESGLTNITKKEHRIRLKNKRKNSKKNKKRQTTKQPKSQKQKELR